MGQIEKITCFKKLENIRNVFQNGLAFLGQSGKSSLCEFPEVLWFILVYSFPDIFLDDRTGSLPRPDIFASPPESLRPGSISRDHPVGGGSGR